MPTLDDLTPDPKNARVRTDRSAKLIEASLTSYGAARSIVIDENGRVLAGNGTVEGAKAAGIKNVKIVEADGDEIIAVRRKGLTEDQKVGLALADNRTSDTSSWDQEMLHELSKQHDLTPWFEATDMDELLGKGDIGSIEDSDGAQEYDPTAFSEFDHKCPRCGFEYDDDADQAA